MSITANPNRLWNKQPTLPRRDLLDGSYFGWIESTDDPKFDEIRLRIEMLWLRIPQEFRSEFIARLRSKKSSDFFSAYNELWYHQALESGGLRCSLPESTPTGSLPDLLLAGDEGPVAIAECHRRGQPDESERNDAVLNRWLQAAYRKMKHKRLWLSVHHVKYGKGLPNASRLAKTLDRIVEQIAVDSDSFLEYGDFKYTDPKSGWAMKFSLMFPLPLDADDPTRLLHTQTHTAWCHGDELLKKVLSLKSRQHCGATLPIVICVGWNHFEQEPALNEVVRVVAEESDSLTKRGVHGVFWTREVYPWNRNPAPPRLLHWGSSELLPVLNAWNGAATDVNATASA